MPRPGAIPKGVLGDRVEYGSLNVWHDRYEVTLTLPETGVFEDIAPRLADLEGDGVPEVRVPGRSTGVGV